MSGKITGLVWDIKGMPRNMKYVLLAYADHAEHDGGGIRPANETIAEKVELSVRSVRRIRRRLEEQGYLVPEGGQGGGRGITSRWRIPVEDNRVIPQPPQKGDKDVPLSQMQKEDSLEQKGASTVLLSTKRGTKRPQKEDSMVSPELLTINTAEEEDARAREAERPEIFRVFEAEIGPITPHTAEVLRSLEAEHPPAWIIAAMRDASARGKRSLKYIQAILGRWAVEGYGTAPPWEREGKRGKASSGRKKKPPEESEADLAKRRAAAATVLKAVNHDR